MASTDVVLEVRCPGSVYQTLRRLSPILSSQDKEHCESCLEFQPNYLAQSDGTF